MRLIKVIVSLILILFLTEVFAASTGKISGIVKDATTGEPLPGVNVLVEDTFLGGASDLEGYFVILNVPPGTYTVKAMMVGYASSMVTNVRVMIDQTTVVNFELSEEALDIGETITVIAERPVVEKDVAASRANISAKDIEAIPVMNVSSVVALQAGIEGSSFRGGGSDEVAWIVNGLNLRNERNNTPYNAISYTSVEEIQVQTGGFSAEFGQIRSGLVNVVTKEGDRKKYDFSFLGRYSPSAQKHFGHSPNSPDAYWIRPYVDPEVAWVGTKGEPFDDLNNNGVFDSFEEFTDVNNDGRWTGWDPHTQAQFPEWIGFYEKSKELIGNDNEQDDMSPEALQQLFLWEHRRELDIQDPDFDVDMSFGGPVPFVSEKLGDLRFHSSYRNSQSMYIIPLSRDGYRDYNYQLKLTSDIEPGMKLMVSGLMGSERGTGSSRSGAPGIFSSAYNIAYEFYNHSYGQGAMFGTDYWAPTRVNYRSWGAKLSHTISDRTFYEAKISSFTSDYSTNPGRSRDFTPVRKFGDNWYVDEAPFGWYDEFSQTANEDSKDSKVNSMRMGVAFATSRDSSLVTNYITQFDITSQLNRYNNIQAGVEFTVTSSKINYARRSSLQSSDSQTKWEEYPIRGAFYVQDKLEFENMIAQLGIRVDYSYANTGWYEDYNPFDPAFSAKFSTGIDTMLNKESAKLNFTFSPRLAIAFPITINSKLYFNYGHFRQLPQPSNLYLLERHPHSNQVEWLANPNNPLEKTIAYELGYEHNIYDQFLLRTAGYYKDVSMEPKSIYYDNFDGSVSYGTTEPNSYRDIRGFEITLDKNRGNWVKGFVNYTYRVTTSGFFGYDHYYENPAQQRSYEREFKRHYQSKPVPQPFARANITFFAPEKIGPSVSEMYPLGSWRLNLLGSWRAGSYTTWTGGGGSIPGVQYNLQWKDYFGLDLRMTKNFRFKNTNFEFFVDINNVFDTKRLSFTGFYDGTDYLDYMRSLHFPGNTDGVEQFGYINIPGEDQPGTYRDYNVEFVPITARRDANSVPHPNDRDLYYFEESLGNLHGEGFYRYQYDPNDYNSGSWYREDKSRVDQILEDKAYIDMPNFRYFTFLNPRDIFWGLRISFEF